MKIRVYYEDTDAGGIVYHTNYIKYCERARSEIFFKQNMIPLQEEKSGFVVKDIQASFLATATLGDVLEIRSKVIKLKHVSCELLQEIYKDDTKVFSMEIVLVYVKNGKPTYIPDVVKEVFSAYIS